MYLEELQALIVQYFNIKSSYNFVIYKICFALLLLYQGFVNTKKLTLLQRDACNIHTCMKNYRYSRVLSRA